MLGWFCMVPRTGNQHCQHQSAFKQELIRGLLISTHLIIPPQELIITGCSLESLPRPHLLGHDLETLFAGANRYLTCSVAFLPHI
jgi:hypothetical protein